MTQTEVKLPEVITFLELAQCVFKSRDLAHIAHLKTTSYAEHVALQEYYEGVVPLVDELVEAYQGHYNELLEIVIPESKFENPEEFLVRLQSKTMNQTWPLPIQNVLEEISTLISSTLYKLRFLS